MACVTDHDVVQSQVAEHDDGVKAEVMAFDEQHRLIARYAR
jgi:hypothetical protein